MNTEDTLAKLAANGYWPFNAHIDDVDHAAIAGSKRDYYFQDGAFANGQRTYMANAQASVAVLTFDFKEPSEGAMQFSNALVALLAPKDKLFKKFDRPLVRLTPSTTEFIYREHRPWVMRLEIDFGPTTRALFPHGLKIANSKHIATLECAATDVIVDDGTWMNQDSPLTRVHADLPEWDQEGISTKLQTLVDKLAATGSVKECEPFQETAPSRQFPRAAGVSAPTPAQRDPRVPVMRRRSDGQQA